MRLVVSLKRAGNAGATVPLSDRLVPDCAFVTAYVAVQFGSWAGFGL